MKKHEKTSIYAHLCLLVVLALVGSHVSAQDARLVKEAIDKNTIKVTFSNNKYVTKQTAQQFIFNKAAEITINSGYNFFELQKSHFFTEYVSTDSRSTRVVNNLYDSNNGRGTSVTYSRYTFSTVLKMYSNPRSSKNIHFYDAREVLQRKAYLKQPFPQRQAPVRQMAGAPHGSTNPASNMVVKSGIPVFRASGKLDKDPSREVRDWTKKSEQFIEQKNWLEVIRTASAAIDLNANYDIPYVNRATAYLQLGEYEDKAISDIDTALALNPDNAPALNLKGYLLQQRGYIPQAVAYYERSCSNKMEVACTNYEELAGFRPDKPGAREAYYLNLSASEFKAGNWQNVVLYSNEVLKSDPKNVKALTNRSAANTELGNLPQALSDINDAIILNPDFAAAYNNRGYIYERMGKARDAILEYQISCNLGVSVSCDEAERLKEQNPGIELAQVSKPAKTQKTAQPSDQSRDIKRYLELSDVAFQQKKWIDVLNHSNKILSLEPNHPQAYTNRAGALAELGRHKQAIADASQAININPQFAPAFNNRGYAYELMGDKQNAIKDYQKSCELGIQVACKEVEKLEDQGVVANASTGSPLVPKVTPPAIPTGVASTPKPAELTAEQREQIQLYLSLTNNAFAEKNWDEAVKLSNQIIAMEPDNVQALTNRTGALAELGRLDQAIKDGKRAIKLDPGFAAAYNNLGYVHEKKAEYQLAASNYQKACDLGIQISCSEALKVAAINTQPKKETTEKPSIKQYLQETDVAFQDKNWDGVIELSSNILREDPNNVQALTNRSGAYAEKGDLHDAVRDATAAISINPKFAPAYNNRGYAYELMGKKDLAVAEYQKSCDLGIDISCSEAKKLMTQ